MTKPRVATTLLTQQPAEKQHWQSQSSNTSEDSDFELIEQRDESIAKIRRRMHLASNQKSVIKPGKQRISLDYHLSPKARAAKTHHRVIDEIYADTRHAVNTEIALLDQMFFRHNAGELNAQEIELTNLLIQKDLTDKKNREKEEARRFQIELLHEQQQLQSRSKAELAEKKKRKIRSLMQDAQNLNEIKEVKKRHEQISLKQMAQEINKKVSAPSMESYSRKGVFIDYKKNKLFEKHTIFELKRQKQIEEIEFLQQIYKQEAIKKRKMEQALERKMKREAEEAEWQRLREAQKKRNTRLQELLDIKMGKTPSVIDENSQSSRNTNLITLNNLSTDSDRNQSIILNFNQRDSSDATLKTQDKKRVGHITERLNQNRNSSGMKSFLDQRVLTEQVLRTKKKNVNQGKLSKSSRSNQQSKDFITIQESTTKRVNTRGFKTIQDHSKTSVADHSNFKSSLRENSKGFSTATKTYYDNSQSIYGLVQPNQNNSLKAVNKVQIPLKQQINRKTLMSGAKLNFYKDDSQARNVQVQSKGTTNWLMMNQSARSQSTMMQTVSNPYSSQLQYFGKSQVGQRHNSQHQVQLSGGDQNRAKTYVSNLSMESKSSFYSSGLNEQQSQRAYIQDSGPINKDLTCKVQHAPAKQLGYGTSYMPFNKLKSKASKKSRGGWGALDAGGPDWYKNTDQSTESIQSNREVDADKLTQSRIQLGESKSSRVVNIVTFSPRSKAKTDQKKKLKEFLRKQKERDEFHESIKQRKKQLKQDLISLLNKCTQERSAHKELLDDFNHVQLVNGIMMHEEDKLQNKLKQFEGAAPIYLKDFIHEKHKERLDKNEKKREVRAEHVRGIADPGRLAANLEKRMFFQDYIKKDDFGRKKHLVQL